MESKKLFLFDGSLLDEEQAIRLTQGIVWPCARFFNQQSQENRQYLSPHLFEGYDVIIKLLLMFNFKLWSNDNIDRLLQQDLQVIEHGYLINIFFSPLVRKYRWKASNFDYFLSQVKQSDNTLLQDLVKGYYSY